jgi:thymidylate kinase
MTRLLGSPGATERERADFVSIQSPEPRVIARASAYPSDTIPALGALLDELAEKGVRYCLWKSNIRLRAALAGETDLDLLVERDQGLLFREILGRHRLKPLMPHRASAHPGMEHFLGMDGASGRLFHLHVHYQLVLGEQYVKNYRLPMESQVLSSVRLVDGVPVPIAAVELSILAVRALLKYRGRDGVKDVLGIRSPGIPEGIQNEIAWLLAQTTVAEVRAILEGSGAPVPKDVVSQLLETITRSPRSGYTFLLLRSRLRRAMRPFRRRSRPGATIEYWRTKRRRRRLRRLSLQVGMTPFAGGLTIALVGADGSGKSTVADGLARWLSWKLEVRVKYLGSNMPSPRGDLVYLAFRALRRVHRAVSKSLGPGSRVVRWIGSMRDFTLALHCLAIGRDRARRYRDGESDIQAGRVVIFDRFPLETLSSQSRHRALDGPRISRAFGESTGPVKRALAGAEERIYKGFRLPDYLVVLDVSPEVSADRKPDHSLEILREKSRAAIELAALAEMRYGPAGMVKVDANLPLPHVLQEIKRRIWDVL